MDNENKDCFKDCYDIIFKVRDEITSGWRISTTLNTLMLGWILFFKFKVSTGSMGLTCGEQTLIVILIFAFYLIGYIMSAISLIRSYELYSIILSDVDEKRDSMSDGQKLIIDTISKNALGYSSKCGFLKSKYYVIALHAFYALILSYLLFWI